MGHLRTKTRENVFRCAILYAIDEADVKDWYDVDQYAIVIILKDQSRVYYDGLINQYRYLPRRTVMTEEDFAMEFAERLKRYMYLRSMRQKDLVEETGIARHTISDYMNGKRIPSIYTAVILCEALSCDLEELFYIN